MNAIEMALKMEEDAINFYTEAAERTSHPAGKKMFEIVVLDERKHLAVVEKILKGLDIHMEETHPIRRIRSVFEELEDRMMERVEATEDDLEAFRIAMNMEKEGLQLYKDLLSESVSEKEKTLYEKLIDEEKQHYSIFENTYNFLSDTGNWFMWKEYSIVDGGTEWA